MKREMKRADVVNELAERTGIFKKYLKPMLDALDDILLENMAMATPEEPSSVEFAGGKIKIGGKFVGAKKHYNLKKKYVEETDAYLGCYMRTSVSLRKIMREKGEKILNELAVDATQGK